MFAVGDRVIPIHAYWLWRDDRVVLIVLDSFPAATHSGETLKLGVWWEGSNYCFFCLQDARDYQPMATALQQSKSFLLSGDLAERRSWQLWVDKNGRRVRILQTNQTNPRITKVSAKRVSQLINITTSMPEYEARIIKSETLEPLISSRFQYYISFDGVDKIRFNVAAIEESQQQDLYWRLVLTRV